MAELSCGSFVCYHWPQLIVIFVASVIRPMLIHGQRINKHWLVSMGIQYFFDVMQYVGGADMPQVILQATGIT